MTTHELTPEAQAEQSVTAYRRAIGRDLRTLRKSRGWTLRNLSDEVNRHGHHIATMSLSRIEQGARDMRGPEIIALALAFGVSAAELLTPSDPGDDGTVHVGNRAVRWDVARRWVAGEVPLLVSVADELDNVRNGQYDEVEHLRAPHALPPMSEIAWQVRRSTPHVGPHRICVESAYGQIWSSVDGGSAEEARRRQIEEAAYQRAVEDAARQPAVTA